MAVAEDAIEISALGRPFQLGMLYDCRKDALIPGVTLWDYSSLQKDLTTRPQPNTATIIIASDSIDDKASALDISASLKASVLGGLIDVRGSAKYLHDTKKSKKQARVTVLYKTTTRYEQLTMSHLGIQNISYPAVFEHGTATHVVTAILYGAQAFFVFDREVSSMEMVKNVEGNLHVTLTKEISIGGRADMKLNEEEKENAFKFSCTFHGDFSLEKNPVTFQDAMTIYETLPKMLGKDGEKAVPVWVSLYPLTKLDTRAVKMVREISLVLIFDVENILEELDEIQMQSNDLAKDPICDTFPEIKRKIQQLRNLLKQHRQMFQKQLARTLPSIRGGGQEEATLVDLLTSVSQSPFNSQRLREFLNTKKREINFVKSYLTILNSIQVISSQNKLEKIVLDPQNGYVVSYIFTSLHEEEPFLLSLRDWLQEQFSEESAKSTRSTLEVKKGMAWFEDKERTQYARQTAKAIKDFFSVNQSNENVRFVVASLRDVDRQGASIYLYEDGELVSKNFELPSKPLPLQISELRHDSIHLRFQPAEYGTATISSYLVEYKIAGEENWKTVRTEDAGETFLLKNLPPNTEYQFQYACCCKPGRSKSSDLSPPIKTLPISPPEKLRKVTAASTVISVAWMSPGIVASGVVVKENKVEYRTIEAGVGKDHWTEKRTGNKTELYPIEGLKPQTAYRIRVSAVCDNGALGVPSEEVEVSTSLEEEDADNVAHQFLQESSLVEERQPLVFALPLEKVPSDPSTSSLLYQLGKENLEVPNKVILVIGATGCGKTTLINGMINYILGVQWGDNFRFKLIHETIQRSEAESRTSEVTAYVVNHRKGFRIPYSLTIINTPGFGGTRDAEQDKLAEKHLRELFSTPGGIDHVDAICLVAQAFLAPSAHAQKCVFDSILSMLGKDVKDNVQLLITFSDGGTPPVLEALKEADLPCAQDESGTPLHFRFNHSALFAHRENGGSCNAAAEMFWKMSTESMKNFFESLKMLERKSLALTMEVLKERQELEAALRRPPPPNIEPVQPKSFQISIDAVAVGKPSVSRYQVEYRIAGEENWKSLHTEGPQDQFSLEDVHLNLQYQFRCAAVTQVGLGQWSEAVTCICPTWRPKMGTMEEEISLGEDGELRLILVGKSGGGKSATGNTILGRPVFKSMLQLKTTTLKCQRGQGRWWDRKISVVDTPNIFDSENHSEIVQNEITACVKLSRPGPHALIFVTQVGRFTSEDVTAAKCVRDIFEAESARYTIVLFTCVEDLRGESLQDYVQNSNNHNLRELIQRCGNRFCGFNNKAAGAEWQAQVSELMEMVQKTVFENGGKHYVNWLYQLPMAAPDEKAKPGEVAEFRLILVGKTGGGKSATGNTILCRRVFESILQPKATTLKCQRGQGTWQNTKVSVVDTPDIFNSENHSEIVQNEIKACVKLSQPGPHALIFVTQVGRFTAEDVTAAKGVQDTLGDESARHTIVLFTCVEDLRGESLKEYVRKSNNHNLRDLIQLCGNRFCGFNNKAAGAEWQAQVSELMKMVQIVVLENRGRHYVIRPPKVPKAATRDHGTEAKEGGDDADLRLILVGKSGGGKSATGNTILGRREFESVLAAKTTTRALQTGQGTWDGKKITVINTPALFDSKVTDPSLKEEMKNCRWMCQSGLHAFVLVTQVGRFTKEDQDATKRVREIFGEKSVCHTIVLFTCKEDLGEDSLQEYVEKCDNKKLRKLIEKCGNRFCGFNNRAEGAEREKQVSELMKEVQKMVNKNGKWSPGKKQQCASQ